MNIKNIQPGMRVVFVDALAVNDTGTVSSVSDVEVFVKFDEAVAVADWEGAPAYSCNPECLAQACPTCDGKGCKRCQYRGYLLEGAE